MSLIIDLYLTQGEPDLWLLDTPDANVSEDNNRLGKKIGYAISINIYSLRSANI